MFPVKGKVRNTRDVARALNATHLLCGSARCDHERVRITARRIDGRTDRHVWAERYDRDLSDIFALSDEISTSIVSALQLRLLPEDRCAISHHRTDNVEAHNLYLMAREL